MKNLIVNILGLMIATSAFAGVIGDDHAAFRLRDKIEPRVLEIEGVNGIGIGGCDPVTGGESDFRSDHVACVTIYTETEEAAARAAELYPQGRLIDGVFVIVSHIGIVVPQPRISVGN